MVLILLRGVYHVDCIRISSYIQCTCIYVGTLHYQAASESLFSIICFCFNLHALLQTPDTSDSEPMQTHFSLLINGTLVASSRKMFFRKFPPGTSLDDRPVACGITFKCCPRVAFEWGFSLICTNAHALDMELKSCAVTF